MLRYIIMFLSLGIILFFFRHYNHDRLNQAAAERRYNSNHAVERQNAVPLRRREDSKLRQRP